MTTFLKNNSWSILWGLFILVLLMMPGNDIPRVPMWIERLHPDKAVHLFIFAVFAFLLVNGFRKPGSPSFIIKYALLLAMLISIFIGGTTELLQGWIIPLRTADWKDFYADGIGTLTVIVALWAHRFLKQE
ncbi:MAG: VanZ family protein [Bacteroidota bacterium]